MKPKESERQKQQRSKETMVTKVDYFYVHLQNVQNNLWILWYFLDFSMKT